MDQETVIEKLKQFKALLSGYYNLNSVYLFGSYATGNQNEYSDIDVAVVVNELVGDYLTYTPLLWQLRRGIDTRIEPVLFELGKDPSGFLEEIKHTGIEI
ncbi:MAG: nucleotidyltransferase domain-containing protein [Ignavibacteriales bacterium]|nr:nucleotidyltransferase domain-containing protein [Ignavibacteriales bacterium]